jgi:hypothetical protein
VTVIGASGTRRLGCSHRVSPLAPEREELAIDVISGTAPGMRLPSQSRWGSVVFGGRSVWGRASFSPVSTAVLPPTSPELLQPATRPYFLWWTDVTVGDLRELLASEDLEVRAYWMGALLREANTRDVWLFVRPAGIRALWPRLIRYLGRSRAMWSYLLGLELPAWPPLEARGA